MNNKAIKKQHTIVIVEDNDDSRTLLETMVKSLGFNALSYPSGEDTLEGIEGKAIDLFLLDVMMPEMNGYELMEAIRSIDAFKTVPVIMVTAKDQDNEVLEGYKTGADYYITKPYTSQQLKYGIKLFIDLDE